jgi:hypothetical protein
MIRDIRGRSDYGRLTLPLEHTMRDLLLPASPRVTRVVGPCAVLWLLAGYSASAGAQPAATAPIDGPDFVTFRGFAGPIEMHYVMGLAPVAAGAACGR